MIEHASGGRNAPAQIRSLPDAADGAGDAAGQAALSIAESLALALVESGALSREDILAALDDARRAHMTHANRDGDGRIPGHAADLIGRVIESVYLARTP